MNKIKALNPDMIYFGGTTQSNTGQIIKDMRNVGMAADAVKFMGPDGIKDQALIDAAGKDAQGMYATFGGLPPQELTGVGAKWYESYKAKYNAERKLCAYAMKLLKLRSAQLIKLQNDRAAIREAVLQLKILTGTRHWSLTPTATRA